MIAAGPFVLRQLGSKPSSCPRVPRPRRVGSQAEDRAGLCHAEALPRDEQHQLAVLLGEGGQCRIEVEVWRYGRDRQLCP